MAVVSSPITCGTSGKRNDLKGLGVQFSGMVGPAPTYSSEEEYVNRVGACKYGYERAMKSFLDAEAQYNNKNAEKINLDKAANPWLVFWKCDDNDKKARAIEKNELPRLAGAVQDAKKAWSDAANDYKKILPWKDRDSVIIQFPNL